MNAQTSPLTPELEAALQWWQLAGVDCDFSDDATDWMAAPAPSPTKPEPKPSPNVAAGFAKEAERKKPVERVNLLGDSPPGNLDSFRKWWVEAPGLDAIGPRGRIPSRGPADADLMVLVIDPEHADSTELLSGPKGRLLSNMLSAMGVDEAKTCVASALPRHTPLADTQSLAEGGMDAVTAHHIAIAAPKRILAFGGNILPLIGHELPKDRSSLREINQTPSSMPILVSEGLDSLMAMPRLKARFWRRWIEWSAD